MRWPWDQKAIEINGHDFLVDKLAAFATKVLGLQQLFDKLVKLFLLPAKMVEFPQRACRVCGFAGQSGDEQGCLASLGSYFDHSQPDRLRRGLAVL